MHKFCDHGLSVVAVSRDVLISADGCGTADENFLEEFCFVVLILKLERY